MSNGESHRTMPDPPTEVDVAVAWWLAARAMVAARPEAATAPDASAGLYGQAILGLSQEACLEAKSSDWLGGRTLVDCLGLVSRFPSDTAQKIVTGVMMLSLTDAHMHPLEVRWASMLASAASLSADEFHRCCASARVIAGMLRPRDREADA